jgi:catechol 2,3-dioxygenase-like lactoylglutathione lyase family enzyme
MGKIMSAQKNISLTEIGQISVNVHDLDRAVAFYKETLGMKHLFTVPGRMAFFDCGGIRNARDPGIARCSLRNQTDVRRADGNARSLAGRVPRFGEQRARFDV